MDINLQTTAEILSNGLAIPMILLSLAVVILWFKPACTSIKHFKGTPEQWFIIGVFGGFLGEFADNIYWTIAWSLKYLTFESAALWMERGVFANIPFRQGLGMLAAYCHVRSALEHRKQNYHTSLLNYLLIIAIVIGFMYSIGLIIIKN